MKFLVDSQLPVTLARFLSNSGSECLHVLDIGLAQAPDSVIWRHAAEGGLIVISKDEDFFHRAARPGAPVQLVWIRVGNCGNRRLLELVGGSWSRVRACLDAGERVVEVR